MGYTKNTLKHKLTVYYGNFINSIIIEDYGKNIITLGRSDDNDFIVNSPIISNQHTFFKWDGLAMSVFDNNSRNGISLNGVSVNSAYLENGDILRIDSLETPLKEGVIIIYSVESSNHPENWINFSLSQIGYITLGRDQENDIVLSHGIISKKHAAIEYLQGAYYIEDLHSSNGTFLNGTRIFDKVMLKLNDVIFIGNTKLIFSENYLHYNILSAGLKLEALELRKSVRTKGATLLYKEKKVILDNISITINPGELVAVMGPSGSGKSTLLSALSGFNTSDSGHVLINGDDYYKNYDAIKGIIGYVPQTDPVYENLTVAEMLRYTAKLRMPKCSNSEEIDNRIQEVVAEVFLEGTEYTLIKNLSGGQRKRVSIASELLADPKLIFLDEPTTGLDPDMVMNISLLLKQLSFQGKTIIFTTHSTTCLNLCDKVLCMGPGGKLCFFGLPTDALAFFQTNDFDSIYQSMASYADYWVESFEKSNYYIQHKSIHTKSSNSSPQRIVKTRLPISQLTTLIIRYFKLTYRDRIRFLLIIVQAPMIAVLLGLVSGKNTFRIYEDARLFALILSCAAIWMGLLNSIQEISKEKQILLREKAANLSILDYIFSKCIVLGGVCFIQSVLLIITLSQFIPFPGSNLIFPIGWELIVTIFMTCTASTATGLFLSSFVKNSDRALGLMPVLLLFEILFSGQAFSLKGLGLQISHLAVSKWTIYALGTSLNFNKIPWKSPIMTKQTEAIYLFEPSNLYSNWAIICLFASIFTLVGIIKLKYFFKKIN